MTLAEHVSLVRSHLDRILATGTASFGPDPGATRLA
jgi:hypothetical protein